ncbi:MAG: hypothetical protein NZ845_01140 [Thermodesulfovibrio sp.]|nr:hypothetical protein [Thermodesulfovibrio sp.]
MIRRLNSIQEKNFERHAAIWLERRFSCNDIERETVRLVIETFYKKINTPLPNIVFLESPFGWNWEKDSEGYLTVFVDSLIFDKSLWKNFWEELVFRLDRKLSENLEEKIKLSLLKDLNEKLMIDFWLIIIKKISLKFSWALIDTLLRKQIGEKSLYSKIRQKIISKGLGFYLIDSLKMRVKELFEESLLNFYWIAFYEFSEKYLECKYDKEDSILLNIFSEIAYHCFLCWPFKNICVVSNWPIKISYVDQKIIFKDGYFL